MCACACDFILFYYVASFCINSIGVFGGSVWVWGVFEWIRVCRYARIHTYKLHVQQDHSCLFWNLRINMISLTRHCFFSALLIYFTMYSSKKKNTWNVECKKLNLPRKLESDRKFWCLCFACSFSVIRSVCKWETVYVYVCVCVAYVHGRGWGVCFMRVVLGLWEEGQFWSGTKCECTSSL